MINAILINKTRQHDANFVKKSFMEAEANRPGATSNSLYAAKTFIDEILDTNIAMLRGFADKKAIKAISAQAASDFARAWLPYMEYLNGRIQEFVRLEAGPLFYQDPDIRRLFDVASIVFYEQVRLSVWLCQNVWYRMAKVTETPEPLKRLGPYMLEPPSLDDPHKGHVAVTDIKVESAWARGIKKPGPQLVLARNAQPIYMPRQGELRQSETVEVRITVAMDGGVFSAEAVSGSDYLHDVAARAARSLKYLPLKDTGFTSPQTTTVTFNFLPPIRN
jgi:hypothetical protein